MQRNDWKAGVGPKKMLEFLWAQVPGFAGMGLRNMGFTVVIKKKKKSRGGNPGKPGITPGNTGKQILQNYQDEINKNSSGFVQRPEALERILPYSGPKIIIKIVWEMSHILQMNQELRGFEGCRKPLN